MVNNNNAKPSLVDQSVSKIIDIIQSDHISVGEKLYSENELMKLCGAGRSTIREALRLLQAKGYIELRPNAGAFIFSKNPDRHQASRWIAEHKNEMIHVLEIRLAIEGIAAHMAAQKATEQDIYILVGIQSLMEQAADENDSMKLALYDADFHQAIATATYSPLIIEINKQLTTASANFRGNTFLVNKGHQACQAHKKILNAIQAKESDLAKSFMQKHMQKNIDMAKALMC